MKLTMQKLKDMKAKWAANKPKLKACRADVKAKGLAGDDRWFYIEECMRQDLRPRRKRVDEGAWQRAAACPLNAYRRRINSLGIWHARA